MYNYTVYVRKLANKYLTLERFIWYILLRFDMTVSSIEGDRVSTATTFAFTMRAWPVARSIFDAPLGEKRTSGLQVG